MGGMDDCKECPCPAGVACHVIDIVEGAGSIVGVDDGHPGTRNIRKIIKKSS